MLMAEIRCRQAPRPPWSVALSAASRTVKFWKISISGLQTGLNVHATLSKLGEALQWDYIPQNGTMEESKLALKAACKSLNQCRKEAKENRQTFLDDKIEAAAKADDTTTEKLLKKLWHCEAQSACFTKLAYALKPAGNKGGVTKVELVIYGETVAFTEKQDVERETKQSNKRHFNAAVSTPFTVFPLSEVGTTETSFKTSHLPHGTAVKIPADTSPSGHHLGHYKLLVKTFEDKHAGPELKAATGEILQLMVDIMDLASNKGFILEWWTKVINAMLYKKPGIYLMNKLRIIHLFEADYNFIIGTIFGRRALYSGVDNKTLHPSQWAQPGRQCSDVVVMRELTIAVAKMMKTPLAGFENDASACYDRIVMNIVAAIFDRLGVSPGPLRLQEQTLLHVIHYLKTGFGISNTSYTSDSTSRIYGVGQGSKADPVTWAAVCSILFEAQDLLGTGLTFKTPDRTLTHQ
jgi:hypothetical protein